MGKDKDYSGKRTVNVDTKAAKSGRGVSERGLPILKVGGVPGYNMSTGTPGWVRKAADRAEASCGKDNGAHAPMGHRADYDHATGRPPYGKTAEVDPKRHTQGGDGVQRIKKGRGGDDD